MTDIPHKPAPVPPQVIEPIRIRWSPRSFSAQNISEPDLRTIMAAAQWAASTYNEQEWRYIIARRQDAEQFARAVECLTEANQRWAKGAAVLMFCLGRPNFTKTGQPNPVWHYDCGLASSQLVIQAMAMGIHVHQMAGIKHGAIRKTYGVPAEFEPLAGIALGYAASPEKLPEDLRKAELAERTRRPLEETVFAGSWGQVGI